MTTNLADHKERYYIVAVLCLFISTVGLSVFLFNAYRAANSWKSVALEATSTAAQARLEMDKATRVATHALGQADECIVGWTKLIDDLKKMNQETKAALKK